MIIITGPTATGKTALAVALARQIGGEIISADSRQVYEGMDIGTGKDLTEYQEIPYHLIDICKPGEQYNVFRFQQDFDKAHEHIIRKKKQLILCGGTGLYIDAALRPLKFLEVPPNLALRSEFKTLDQVVTELKKYKSLHNTSDSEDMERALRALEIEMYKLEHPQEKRTVEPHIVFAIYFERSVLKNRITLRLQNRLEQGMIAEVELLLKQGVKPEDLIYYGLEYKYLTNYILGVHTKEEMVEGLNIAIHQFAKRQMTWFRRMEKLGTPIHWINGELSEEEKLEVMGKEISKNHRV